MTPPKIICFRATESMCDTINRIMDERLIDRTTVIKLALYHFDSYMRKHEVRQKDLYGIVQDLESEAAPEQEKFEQFSIATRRRYRL